MPTPSTRIPLIARLVATAALTLTCNLCAYAQSAEGVGTQIVADGLEHPWAVAPLPDGRFLVTERPGRMRLISAAGQVAAPLSGVPAVAAGGQGGLLDVITDSDFTRNRTIYFCFSEPGPKRTSGTALASARLAGDDTGLEAVHVLFRQRPKIASQLHFGCRIVERLVDGQPDGTLFLTLGERFTQRDSAQKLDNDLGKIVRIGKDGSVPADNPFVGREGALPEIWSFGHRNVQGATWGPDGHLWTHEHGPMGGDEINRPGPGKNYGWPVVSFGVNYDGSPVGSGKSTQPGMTPPLHHWTPSIAPSGMAFLTSTRYGKAWRGNLFVGSLKFQYLDRIELRGDKVVAEHKLLEDVNQRIRDVRQGPDGLLYVVTDADRGQLLRLVPETVPNTNTR